MAARGGKASNRTTWILVGVVLIVGIALLVAVASSTDKKTAGDFITGDEPAPASLVSKVTGVSDSVITSVGAGAVDSPPIKLPGPTLTSSDGNKPRILYVGSEYCPYCATERWAMVNALSRFGTFDNLRITSSAKTTSQGTPEVYPGTGTFSFNGSTYKSNYIQFEPVEQYDNSYKPLGSVTAEQDQLMKTYDAPPYVDASSVGAIPFIDFANQYLISGASYSPQVLQGKTRTAIAGELSNASSDVTQGVIGAANMMTATICKVTDNKPANVCNNSAIQALQAQLPTQVPSSSK